MLEPLLQKLKLFQGSAQIPKIPIQAGEVLLNEIHKLFNSIWNKKELPDQWKGCCFLLVLNRAVKLTVLIIMGYHCH
jgi:hypothetical protein